MLVSALLTVTVNGTLYDEGNPVATSRILENIGAYVALMRNHIHKEDHCSSIGSCSAATKT